jgi:hypothetical protein
LVSTLLALLGSLQVGKLSRYSLQRILAQLRELLARFCELLSRFCELALRLALRLAELQAEPAMLV